MKNSPADGIPPHPKDPITRNPAPLGHPAHEAWERATREAERKLFRFEADMLAKRPAPGEDRGTWLIRLHLGTFQIWAERGLCMVQSHKGARAFEEWLESYRAAYLRTLKENPPRGTDAALLLGILTDEFLRAVRHWSGNALEKVAAIEAGRAAVNAAENGGTGRRGTVDAFLLKCKQENVNATRTHIWRAVGHKTARQFQYWQTSDPKATEQDDQNFRRILSMNPTDFQGLLKKKGNLT